jgi:hydroxymethylpyrimidine pyrophosphatase-like HAD family hydrolase
MLFMAILLKETIMLLVKIILMSNRTIVYILMIFKENNITIKMITRNGRCKSVEERSKGVHLFNIDQFY